MTIPSFSKQSNVEERWGQVTSTTYERWRKRNWQKMDAWIRGTDPKSLENDRKISERLETKCTKKKSRIRRSFKKDTEAKRYI